MASINAVKTFSKFPVSDRYVHRLVLNTKISCKMVNLVFYPMIVLNNWKTDPPPIDLTNFF